MLVRHSLRVKQFAPISPPPPSDTEVMSTHTDTSGHGCTRASQEGGGAGEGSARGGGLIYLYYILELFGRKSINIAMADFFLFKQKLF